MKRIVFLSFLAVSIAAHAEWTPLAKSPEFGENYYIDLQSIKEVEGGKEVLTLSDYPNDKKDACQGDSCSPISSSRISVRMVECDARRQRQIKFTDYDGQLGTGNVTQTASGGPRKRYFHWYTPSPGSFFEALINKVCAP